jgi:hypothetical protein
MELEAQHGTLCFAGMNDPNMCCHLSLQTDDSTSFASKIPNKNRQIDNSEDLWTIWMPFWADDVSGARSKQYQKHINVYTFNANLPARLASQEFHIRFISTSPFAGALEQMAPIVKAVTESLDAPVKTFDVSVQRPCSFRTLGSDMPADNPQQSEEASHIGHQATQKCRKCTVGGDAGFEATVDGYSSFYKPGPLQDVDTIRGHVWTQLTLAMTGVAKSVSSHQTLTGVKDKIAQHYVDILLEMARERLKDRNQTLQQVKEELTTWLKNEAAPAQPYNPLLDMPRTLY